MPIPVEIEGGITLSFPDGTPDEQIDAAVQRLIGAKPAGEVMPPDSNDLQQKAAGSHGVMMALMKALGDHANNAMAEQQAQRAQESDRSMRSDEERATMTAMTIEAVSGAAQDLAGALAAGLEPLAQAAGNTASLPQLVLAINNLSATVLDTGKAIIEVLNQDSVIKHDQHERPVSIGRRKITKG